MTKGKHTRIKSDLQMEHFKSVPHFSDCDIAMRVSGQSMIPIYNNGDVIFCKRLSTPDYVPYGEAHFLVLSDSTILKFVHPHPTDKSLFVLKSENENFEPMEIKRSDVLEIYFVRGKMELT